MQCTYHRDRYSLGRFANGDHAPRKNGYKSCWISLPCHRTRGRDDCQQVRYKDELSWHHVPIPFTLIVWLWDLSSHCSDNAYSMKEYEEKAVSLALDRPKLQSLTNRLKAVRLTCPLFDTERWVSVNRTFIFAATIVLILRNKCSMSPCTCKCRLETWRGHISKCGISIAQASNPIISKLLKMILTSHTIDENRFDRRDCR